MTTAAYPVHTGHIQEPTSSKCSNCSAKNVACLVAFAILAALGPTLHHFGLVNTSGAIAMGVIGGTGFLATLVVIALKSCNIGSLLEWAITRNPEMKRALDEELGPERKKTFFAFAQIYFRRRQTATDSTSSCYELYSRPEAPVCPG